MSSLPRLNSRERDPVFPDRVVRGLHFRFYTFVLCLSWELHLPLADALKRLDAEVGREHFSPCESWALELYEEGRTSFEEGKAVTRLLADSIQPGEEAREVLPLVERCLPPGKRSVLRQQPLFTQFRQRMEALSKPWLVRLFQQEALPEKNPSVTVEREDAFRQFLTLPGFRDAFVRYWHTPPKDRTNRETRILILIAALVRGVGDWHAPDGRERLRQSLMAECHFTEISARDILDVSNTLHIATLNPVFLGQSLAAEAGESDRQNFTHWLEQLSRVEGPATSRRQFAETALRELSCRSL